MNKIGKQGKKNAKANRVTKARFEKEDIRYCQLCGRGENTPGGLSNSHSENRNRKPDLTRSALLCTAICHAFIELQCSHEERQRINDFLIDTNIEGEDRFNAVMRFLPAEKAKRFRAKVLLT